MFPYRNATTQLNTAVLVFPSFCWHSRNGNSPKSNTYHSKQVKGTEFWSLPVSASIVVECIEKNGIRVCGVSSCIEKEALGRKWFAISSNAETSWIDSDSMTPWKRMFSGKMNVSFERSPLEALPQDILIRVLCGVDHEDLKQLFRVSKTIRAATLIAKQWYFEYVTPKKITLAFLDPFDVGDQNEFYKIEAPNAPLRKYKPRITGRKELAKISVALFASAED